MTKEERSVLLGPDHLKKTAHLLDAYSSAICAYFSDFHALLGSAVAMRKALELMGAYYLFYFSKKKILVSNGSDVFHGRYELSERTADLFLRMKAIACGSRNKATDEKYPGIGSILHYQGYRYLDDMPQHLCDQRSLYAANRLFVFYFPEFQDVLRSFCEQAQIDPTAYAGLKALEELLCDAQFTKPLLFNVESQLGITFDESHDSGWLEWYSRILLYYDNNETKDELLVDHTIAACCRSIAEKTLYSRICSVNPAYRQEIRNRENHSLENYIEDYRNCAVSADEQTKEEKRKDLSRAITIRTFTNAMLHWVDRSLRSSLLRFENLQESKSLLIDRQRVVQCGSELIRSVVLEAQPNSIRRLIDRYYDRLPDLYRELDSLMRENEELRSKADLPDAEEDKEETSDLYSQIASFFKKNKESWIEKKKNGLKKKVVAKAGESQKWIRLSSAEKELEQPACKLDASRAALKQLPSVIVTDAPDFKTLVFQVKPVLLEDSHQYVCYLKTLPCTEKHLRDSVKRTYTVEYYSPDGTFDYATEELVMLTVPCSGAESNTVLLNTARTTIERNEEPWLSVGKNPDTLHFIKADNPPRDLSLLAAAGIGMDVNIVGRSEAHAETVEYLSEYSPEKLSFLLIDPSDGVVLTPQIFRDADNKIKIRQKLPPGRSVVSLQVVESSFDSEEEREANIHYRFGKAYCMGDKQLQRNFEAAANEFHAGFETDPQDVVCCYELGCIFRYVDEFRSDDDAYEYLDIAARRGLAEARYQWAKLVLSKPYPPEDKRTAVGYMMELIHCGYRSCGKEKLDSYLPVILPLAEQFLTRMAGAQNETEFWFMADLAAAYCIVGRLSEADQLWRRVMTNVPEQIDALELLESLNRLLFGRGLYQETAQLRQYIRTLRQSRPEPASYDEAEATVEKLERLDDDFFIQNRYRDQMDVLRQIYNIRCAWPIGDENDVVSTLNRLAIAASCAGHNDVSRRIGEEVYAKRWRDTGTPERLRMTAQNNLAYYCQHTGNPEQALELQQEVVLWRANHCGPHDQATLKSKNRLASIYTSLGRFEEAAALLGEALDICRKEEGEDARLTLNVQAFIAWNLHCSGQSEEALEHYAELLPRMRKHMGIAEERTLYAAMQEVRVLCQSNKKAVATVKIEALLPLIRCAFGEDSPYTLEMEHMLFALQEPNA